MDNKSNIPTHGKNYTSGQNISDAQKKYEESVNTARGIHNPSNTQENFQYTTRNDFPSENQQRDIRDHRSIDEFGFNQKQNESVKFTSPTYNEKSYISDQYQSHQSVQCSGQYYDNNSSNYTSGQNISDAQKRYEDSIDTVRGISNSSFQQDEYPHTDYQSLNGHFDPEQYNRSRDSYSSETTQSYETHRSDNTVRSYNNYQNNENYYQNQENNRSSHDYTSGQNISDAQKRYEDSINTVRGIPNSNTQEYSELGQSNGYSKENQYNSYNYRSANEPDFNQKENDSGKYTNSSCRQDYYNENFQSSDNKNFENRSNHDTENQSKAHFQNNTHSHEHYQSDQNQENSQNSYDYTSGQNISDAQKRYEENVNAARGVQNPSIPQGDFNNQRETEAVHNLSGQVQPGTSNTQNEIESHNNFNVLRNNQKPFDYTRSGSIRDAQKLYDDMTKKTFSFPNNIIKDPLQESSAKNVEDVMNEARKSSHMTRTKTESNLVSKQNTGKHANDVQLYTLGGSSNRQKERFYISSINTRRGIDTIHIRSTGIDMSELYENSARGAGKYDELATVLGASTNDIVQLLETRNLKPRTNLTYKVASVPKKVLSSTSHYIYESTTAGTDFGNGVRQMKKIADPLVFMVVDINLMNFDKAMKKHLPKKLNRLAGQYQVFGNNKQLQFIVRTDIMADAKDVAMLKEEICSKLLKTGNKKFNLNDNKILQQQIRGYLRANKGKLTKSEIGALKMLLELAKNDTISKMIIKRRKIFRSKVVMNTFRFLQQTDFGAGAFLIYNTIRRGKSLIRMAVNAVRKAALLVKLAGKLAYKAAAWAAAHAARTKLGQKVVNSKMGKKTGNFVKKQKKKKAERAAKRKARPTLRDKFNRLREPFSMRRHKEKMLCRLKNTKTVKALTTLLSPFNFINRILGTIVATVASAISFVISVVISVVAVLAVAIIVVIFVNVLISSIISLFDFSANSKEIRDAALKKVKSCYESQMDTIEQYYDGRYETVTINYTDHRDTEEYLKPIHKPGTPFKETTNTAEILSMAQIYFKYDLKKAGKDKVLEYVEQLYNGSHLLTITEIPIYGKDKNGDQIIIATNANINYETFYFNSIFDCELTDNANYEDVNGDMSGNTIVPPENLGTYYTYMGWQMITSRSSMQYKLREKAGMNFDSEGFGIINGRYVIACTTTFGKVGDYIDFYLKNGLVIRGVIGDIKNQKDKGANKWGHDEGKAMIEFIVDKRTWYKNGKGSHPNPGTPSCHPEWKSSVKKAINGGSYFVNPEGPVYNAGKFINPLKGYPITSEFGYRGDIGIPGASKNHQGMDIGAPKGTNVIASAGGTVKKVVSADIGGKRGNYIQIDHGSGIETIYQHLCEKPNFSVGDRVEKGQVVGHVGNTSSITKPLGYHLHFELHKNGTPVNPRQYVKDFPPKQKN